MDNRRPEDLLTEVEDLIERIEEIEELGAPESEAATSRRTLSPAEVELVNEFDSQAGDLLDPEAYAEIAPFTADERTTYQVYWDRQGDPRRRRAVRVPSHSSRAKRTHMPGRLNGRLVCRRLNDLSEPAPRPRRMRGTQLSWPPQSTQRARSDTSWRRL
jgi:hypothetical protein